MEVEASSSPSSSSPHKIPESSNDDNESSPSAVATKESPGDQAGEEGKKMSVPSTMTTTEDPRDKEEEEEENEEQKHDEEDDENVGPRRSLKDYWHHKLGGKIEKPAYCLLDGFIQEMEYVVNPFRIAIDRLPAVLGRTHVTSEPNFFGLGKNVKALSRHQCRIDYRVPSGTIGQFGSTKTFAHRLEKPVDILNPTEESLPNTGIYVLTCLGKNPIKVNGMKVEQNEMCVLAHGCTVKFSAFSMYFLLPRAPSSTKMEVPVKVKSGKKRKAEPESTSSSSPPNKKSKIPAFKTMQEELESMSTGELLAQLEMADEKNIWDRRCQFMGATISYRAVREAAQSPELKTAQATAPASAPGVTKQEVVQWIHGSGKFSSWAEIMQRKLEPKSYQTNIAKAMQRAGYERSTTVSVGRHVKWYLPSDLCSREEADETTNEPSDGSDKVKKEEEEEKEDGDDAAENGDAEGNQQKGDEDRDTESGGDAERDNKSDNQYEEGE